MRVSRCKTLLCPKCWNQVVKNFHVYLHAKSQYHLVFYATNLLFLNVLWCLTIPIKIYSISFVENLHADLYAKNQLTTKVMLSICRKLLCLHAPKKKINFNSHVCLEITKRYVNILFWILWVCLNTHNKTGIIKL